MWKCLSAALLVATPVAAQDLGRPATPDEIAAWDIDIRPDGAGLPEGSGDVATGEVIYSETCAVCHGVFGEGVGRWPVLMGGFNTLDGSRPVKTIGSYWPYVSTVWDYVHRAMPFTNPQSLTDSGVYAVTAYLLYLNDLVDEDFVLSHDNLAEVHLPNEDGFYFDDRAETEVPAFSKDLCMDDCKTAVEITMRAAVLDVTPDDAAARAAREDGAGVATDGDGNPVEAAGGIEPDGIGGTLGMAAADPALVAAGERVFRQCRSCHEVGADARNRVGPHLVDVVGRPAGAVEEFQYSPAMESAGAAGLVWDAVSLSQFLADPRGYLQGTKMVFRGLREDEDIEAVIAYLASLDG